MTLTKKFSSYEEAKRFVEEDRKANPAYYSNVDTEKRAKVLFQRYGTKPEETSK